MTSPVRKAQASFVETTIDEETVVMNIESAEFFALNETAGAVWRSIDGQRDVAGVTALVAGEYGVEPARIAGEVEQLIAELRTIGFLEPA